MVSFFTTTSVAYAALTPKDAEALYFVTDTHQVYRGSVLYTGAIQLVTAFPAKGAEGTLYIISSNLEGRIWEASAWKVVAKGYTEKMTATGTDLPTSKAVADYVTDTIAAAIASAPHVKDVTYSNTGNERALNIIKDDETTKKISLTDLITTVAYDATNLTLTFGVSGLSPIVVNLPKDNFIQSGSYNVATKNIELLMKDNTKVLIPAADLIDVYTGKATNTATTTVGADNKISVEARISTVAGNILRADATAGKEGLYVPPTDLSGKLDKLSISTPIDEIVLTGASGTVKTSGKKIGGATVATTPNVNTLATEKAVDAIAQALQGSINDITEALATKLDIANITQTISPSTPSANKVPSEAALVSALSWKTV